MTENYISPKLDSITADVLDNNFVIVKQFKHNSLRGDSYWVTVNKLYKKNLRPKKLQKTMQNVSGSKNSDILRLT